MKLKKIFYQIKNSVKYFFKRNLNARELDKCFSLAEGGYMSWKTYQNIIKRKSGGIVMIKKLFRICVQSFKYRRRLSKLYKTLDVLIEECRYIQNIEERDKLCQLITEIHQYTSDLLKEFEQYLEDNKF